MDYSKLPLSQMMTRQMAWFGARSSVLAQNVANADTPGYEARDLKPLDFKAELKRAGGAAATPVLAVTDPRHLAQAPGGRAPGVDVRKEPEPFETALSGNTVNLEQQMGKLGETQHGYQTVVELYRKHLAMFRTALGRGI
jgi:flagellar basal-body rod protein FlgB